MGILARRLHPLRLLAQPALATAAVMTTLFTWLLPSDVAAQTCDSTNPNDWPASAKPYFMLVVDTSGSMVCCTNTDGNGGVTSGQTPCPAPENSAYWNSCGMVPSRLNDAKCALRQTVQAFGGEVNFGLATFAVELYNCSSGATSCNPSCNDPGDPTGSDDTGCLDNGASGADGEFYSASGCQTRSPSGGDTCGNNPACSSGSGPASPNFAENWNNGGRIVVPLQRDDFWNTPPEASNVAEVLKWFDNNCSDSKELIALGATPTAEALESVQQYLQAGWDADWLETDYCPGNTAYQYTVPSGGSGTSVTSASPLSASDRPCRSVNIILVTDGDANCDGQTAAVNRATALYNGIAAPGGGATYKVRTHVISFAGGTFANAQAIANAGGGVALQAQNEVELAKALSTIISGAMLPEVCNNGDDNCNGCTDEGYTHYCNLNPTCCAWSTPEQRTTCLTNYEGSINANNPLGNQALLPCTSQAQQAVRTTGLCYDPGDVCDLVDNDCDGTIDEASLKCGSPPHCPTAEICNDSDDNCDGVVDNALNSGVPYTVCPNNCQPSPEICDGCDNDCDGTIDDGIAAVPCGYSVPNNCAGTQTCVATPGQAVGACIGGGGQYGTCQNNPGSELCDGLDNDCDGVVDDSTTDAGTPCTPTGTEPTIGTCQAGTTICSNGALVCVGYKGPTTEICDGLDNDCDGTIDDGVTLGVDNPCGTTQGVCTKGTTACVGGAIVCSGGTQPSPEICDSADNDCDGLTDETPLTDGPANPGCWTNSGTTCSFGGVAWDPPPGAGCSDVGSLLAPCEIGTLACQGGAWACVGATPPGVEECNGLDDDCDGVPDDGAPPPGTICGTDIGECTFGTAVCVSGTQQCQGGTGPGPEICDGKDNDCNGLIDDNVPGIGIVCGSSIGECQTGVTSCVSGQIICNGENPPVAETCDGLDNNCDGAIDNTLSDAPTDPDCWNLPGSGCSFENVTWSAPPGAECQGLGALTTPCFTGRLVCQGASGWACLGGQGPAASEVCDNIDNDCDGTVDDNTTDSGGQCGSTDVGECSFGAEICVNGNLVCQGNVEPTLELCDDKDNDCNGTTDDGAPGTGNPCGTTTGACAEGTTQCVGGVLLCQGGTPAQPEICNGIDDDCNGVPDDGTLADAPTDYDCWENPGTTCSFANVTWSAPSGGNCQDLGGLSSACVLGKLACDGANQWKCVGGKLPVEESCDGLDNDCNAVVDDGNPGGGGPCGTDVGICDIGVYECAAGVLRCTAGVQPTIEACNGLDDDCDGETDEGLPLGDSCPMPFDASQYPGERLTGECRPGVLACDTGSGSGGTLCIGGVAPSPEVCDGKDNDCDGSVDELGTAPDGIDGSVDPYDTSANPRHLGDRCGEDEGQCVAGYLVCVNAQVVCTGGTPPQQEICDCLDNDCDGQVDEDDPAAPLCGSSGASCVHDNGFCQCAEPCKRGEFPCPTGTECVERPDNTGTTVRVCVAVGDNPCGDCATAIVRDESGVVVCGPNQYAADGSALPACVCKGLEGCGHPCQGVSCGEGQRCVTSGPQAGTCQSNDNCYVFGCPTGEACFDGLCVTNPCSASNCSADEACKPSVDFQTFRCTPSCADVTCAGEDVCRDGVCIAAPCPGGCASGAVCAGVLFPGAGCVTDACATSDGSSPCPDGRYCQPLTGVCTTPPCSGVVCPSGQMCQNAECVALPVSGGGAGGGGSGGSSGSGGSGGSASGAGGAAVDAGGAGGAGSGAQAGSGGLRENPRKVLGLATGGGGCSCRTARGPEPPAPLGLLAAGAAFVFAASRRRGRSGGAR